MRASLAAACLAAAVASTPAAAGFVPNTVAGIALEMDGRFQSIAKNVEITPAEATEARRMASIIFLQMSCRDTPKKGAHISTEDFINAMGDISGDDRKPDKTMIAANMMLTAYYLRDTGGQVPELCPFAVEQVRY